MPRAPREKSASGIYHIMLRGINQQSIFENDDDCNKIIEILEANKKTTGFKLYAYCLMGNHVHLLIKEGSEDISNVMKRIGGSYAYWYNWQYGRKGHLFQDRFKSEAVEDDSYFLVVLRYIHQNPIMAGLAEKPEEYEWSSYKEYIKGTKLVDTQFVLALFDEDKSHALDEFIKFNQEMSNDRCLEMAERNRRTISDKEVKQLVFEKYGIETAILQNRVLSLQNEVMKYMKELEGTSLRQISRLTGITVNRIFRA